MPTVAPLIALSETLSAAPSVSETGPTLNSVLSSVRLTVKDWTEVELSLEVAVTSTVWLVRVS